jgi:hypothetical protein
LPVLEQDQFFSKDFHELRLIERQFRRRRDRVPITAQKLADRRTTFPTRCGSFIFNCFT